MKPQTLLALDAAGASCSVALWRGGAVVAGLLEAMPRGQSERLVPMVAEVMHRAGAGFATLDAVAVTRGPGGFTGVRIGLATARALALAWRLPLIGVTCFEAVASAVPPVERDTGTLVVVLDAKRSDVHVQTFAGPAGVEPAAPPQALAPAALAAALPPGPLLLAGDGAAQALAPLRVAGRHAALASLTGAIDAAWVAAHVAQLDLKAADNGVRPLYLREPDVTLPPPVAAP